MACEVWYYSADDEFPSCAAVFEDEQWQFAEKYAQQLRDRGHVWVEVIDTRCGPNE
jgi:hypothetical protein